MIRVLLADDHKMFRDGIRNLLAEQRDMEVVGEAEDGRSATTLARTLCPDVVVMDVTMKSLNGIEATRQIRAESYVIKVIALSMHTQRSMVQQMLEAGASGYLLKECAFDELVSAIRVVCEHDQLYLTPEIVSQLVDGFLNPSGRDNAAKQTGLTPREREILQLIAEGKRTHEIAELLHLSVRTIDKHRSQIIDKLRIHSVAGLVRFAIREGITTV